MTSDADDNSFVSAVQNVAANDDACEAVHGIYASLAIEVDQRRPVCDASGKCCRFDSYGHRLYVTTAELGAFVRDLRQRPIAMSEGAGRATRLPVLSTVDACPFQIENLCGVHEIRPFGCRMFYCDPAANDWQTAAYERFHGELQAVHDRFAVPYRYVEWRWALGALGFGGGLMNLQYR